MCQEARENCLHLLVVIRRILGKMRPRYANRDAAISDNAATIPDYVFSLSRTLCRGEGTAFPAVYEVLLLRIFIGIGRLLLESVSVLSGLQVRRDDRQI